MAHYDYRCNDCGFEWELNVPIDDRDKALTEPCPDCGTGGIEPPIIERLFGAPCIGFHASSLRKATPEAFKDLLRNMKTKHRHNTIDV